MAASTLTRLEPRETVDYVTLMSEIRDQYLADDKPWVVCYSGGKDSTALLQLVFNSLAELPPQKLAKSVHVLSNDTLVENPAIAEYVRGQLAAIEKAGKGELFWHRPELFSVAMVTPTLEDSFWVNLIGKGYPSPNRWFRWCTERLKINPTSRYIKKTVGEQGGAIIVLGTRKAESPNRAKAMNDHDSGGKLHEHDLPNAYVYAPIADLSNNEVWAYLLQARQPWGGNNRELLALYRKACKGGECPFVIETGTQSCGKSRFGCWVCTVIDKDQAMESYVGNGHRRMKPLLEYRNWIYDIRQQSCQHVPNALARRVRFGPFLMRTRRALLKRLTQMQTALDVELITPAELARTEAVLNSESAAGTTKAVRRYEYVFENGKRVAALADFAVERTPRQRLGPLFLRKATLVSDREVDGDYSRLTRVAYYEVRS